MHTHNGKEGKTNNLTEEILSSTFYSIGEKEIGLYSVSVHAHNSVSVGVEICKNCTTGGEVVPG